MNRSAIFAAAASLALMAPSLGQDESRADLLERFEQLRSGRSDAEMLEMLFQERANDIALPEDEEFKPSPWIIGVLVEPVEPFIREHLPIPEDAGVKVTQVMRGTPAAKAGMRENDIVISANEEPVGSLEGLKEAVVKAGEAGERLRLEVIRKGETMSVEIEPRERDARGGEPQADRPEDRAGVYRRLDHMQRQLDRQQREIDRLRRQLESLRGGRDER